MNYVLYIWTSGWILFFKSFIPVTDGLESCPVCIFDTSTAQDCDLNLKVEHCALSTPYCMTSFYREPTGFRIEKRCASQGECEALWLEGTSQQQPECLRNGLQAGNGSHLECHYCCENSAASSLCNEDKAQIIPENLLSYENYTSVSVGDVTTLPLVTGSTSHSSSGPGQGHSPLLQNVTCMEWSIECNGQSICDSHTDTVICASTTPFCMTSYYSDEKSYRQDKRCASVSECNLLFQSTSVKSECNGTVLTPGISATPVECHFCCLTHPGTEICNRDSRNVIPANVIDFTSTSTGHDTSSSSQLPSGLNQAIMCPKCETNSRTGEICDETSNFATCQGSTPYCMTSLYRDPGGYSIRKGCAGYDDCNMLWWGATQSNELCMRLVKTNVSSSGSVLECHFCCASRNIQDPFCNSDHWEIVPAYLLIMGYIRPGKNTSSDETTNPLPFTEETNSSLEPTDTVMPVSTTEINTSLESTTIVSIPSFEPTEQTVSLSSDTLSGLTENLNTVESTEEIHTSWKTTDMTSYFESTNEMTTNFDQTNTVNPLISTEEINTLPEPTDFVSNFVSEEQNSTVFGATNTTHPITAPEETSTVFGATSTTDTVTALEETSTVFGPTSTTDTLTAPEETSTVFGPTSTTDTLTAPEETSTVFGATSTTDTVTALEGTSTVFGATSTTDTVTALEGTSTSIAVTLSGSATICAVCNSGCPFFQTEESCPAGFCMTSITDDEYFTRTMTKSCVDEDECYERWWQETSDQNLCLNILSNGNSPTGTAIQCHYCCFGNSCNTPDFPEKSTLYNGAQRGTYNVG